LGGKNLSEQGKEKSTSCTKRKHATSAARRVHPKRERGGGEKVKRKVIGQGKLSFRGKKWEAQRNKKRCLTSHRLGARKPHARISTGVGSMGGLEIKWKNMASTEKRHGRNEEKPGDGIGRVSRGGCISWVDRKKQFQRASGQRWGAIAAKGGGTHGKQNVFEQQGANGGGKVTSNSINYFRHRRKFFFQNAQTHHQEQDMVGIGEHIFGDAVVVKKADTDWTKGKGKARSSRRITWGTPKKWGDSKAGWQARLLLS